MDNKFKKFLKLYDYSLPSRLIARKPTAPRDGAKLLVYDRKAGKVFFDRFFNLTKYLPKKSVLVFNDTKVLPARLVVKKETGGLARILYIGRKDNLLEFLSDRKLQIGSRVSVTPKIFFIIKKQIGSHYFLKSSFPMDKTFEVLEKYGLTPIPPYIKNSPLSEKQLRKEYQTIFAKQKGSVAAPTASLHFTKRLLEKISAKGGSTSGRKKSGRQIVFVTLHVNLGTFAPLTEENIKKSKLHTEYYEISKQSAKILNDSKKLKNPIIAVGTTAIRALESAVKNGKLNILNGATNIFIKEGDKTKFVDGLITNFHVPKSSLMMLVSAFTGRKKLLELYQKAIKKKFRFFSFGDGMLII